MSKNTGSEDLSGRTRLMRNTIVSWVSHFALVVSGFVMPRLMSETIGQEALGIWDFCWSFVNYLNLMGMGMGSSANKYVAEYRSVGRVEELSKLTSTVFCAQTVMASLVLIGSIAVAYTMPYFFGERLGSYLESAQLVVLFLGSSLALQIWFGISRGVMTGFHRWDLHNIIHAGDSLLSMILMILVLLIGGGLSELALVYLVSTVIFETIRFRVAFAVGGRFKLGVAGFSKKILATLLAFGGKSVMINIPPLILTQTVNVIVLGILGPAALAIFARPLALIRHLTTLVNKFTMMLTPTVGSLSSMGETDALSEFTLQTTKFSFAVTIPVICFFIIFGGVLIEVWMGPSYVDTELMITLSLGYVLVISQNSLVKILMGIDRHGAASAYVGLIVAFVFGMCFYYFEEKNWSLADAAILLTLPLSVAFGMFLPVYTCRILDISLLRYLKSSVFVPVLCNIPFIFLVLCALVAHSSYPFLAFCLLLLSVCVLLLVYYIFLLPETVKLSIKRYVVKKRK